MLENFYNCNQMLMRIKFFIITTVISVAPMAWAATSVPSDYISANTYNNLYPYMNNTMRTQLNPGTNPSQSNAQINVLTRTNTAPNTATRRVVSRTPTTSARAGTTASAARAGTTSGTTSRGVSARRATTTSNARRPGRRHLLARHVLGQHHHAVLLHVLGRHQPTWWRHLGQRVHRAVMRQPMRTLNPATRLHWCIMGTRYHLRVVWRTILIA